MREGTAVWLIIFLSFFDQFRHSTRQKLSENMLFLTNIVSLEPLILRREMRQEKLPIPYRVESRFSQYTCTSLQLEVFFRNADTIQQLILPYLPSRSDVSLSTSCSLSISWCVSRSSSRLSFIKVSINELSLQCNASTARKNDS